MNRDPDERAQPEGGPAPDEFEAIVAGWRREGEVPQWPDDVEQRVAPAEAAPGPVTQPTPEDDHFIPPEPPPLPRLGPPAIVGLVLLGLGLVLVVAPGWVGIPEPYGLPLGLLGLASGLGWLVLRLWPDPPSDDDRGDDDGAVL
ncbi:hypothetical protein [Pseudonocardia nigra]|uniref:hypothetical protein n=1 Tax=Pseudonocardia nigra TaxID=1921578 RepID=UPI001C606A8D|nr:hypothetical protein [Pseudonocardia nigra]